MGQALPAGLRLEANSGYMVALTHALGFAPSRAVLDTEPMDAKLFAELAYGLGHSRL